MNTFQATTDIEIYSNGLTVYQRNGQLIAEFSVHTLKENDIIEETKQTTMSKKTFKLVSAIIGAAETIAVALVTYFEPSGATAINASIVIAVNAAIAICNQFTKE